MSIRPLARPVRVAAAAAIVGLLCAGATAGEKRKPTITKLSVDPDARKVELFDAIEKGELDARLIPQSSKGGNLLIENKTKEPLTVNMPAGFVGVQVFKQIGGMGMGGMGMGGMGMGGMGMGGMGMGGMGMGGMGGQSMGGGMGMGMGGMGMGGMGMGGMGGMGMGGGGGFFSIPAETVARVPFKSVCLEYGKAEPMSRMTYEIRPVEEFTKDPTLQTLIGLIGTGRLDPEVAQAAAWHLSDGMTWAQLANLKEERLDTFAPRPYFTPGKVVAAQSLVSIAAAKAREIAAAKSAAEGGTVEVSTDAPAPKPARRTIRRTIR